MKYYVLKSVVDGDDYQEESYGVLLVEKNGNRKYICNVTSNCEKISELVSKMNDFPAVPCHVEDIIEDFKYTLEEGGST